MKKTKLGLSLLTGLTTLSVATPLATSCAKTSDDFINHVHESEEDKLYGISENTYESLKKDYINQYEDKLLERGFIQGTDAWNEGMNSLNLSLKVFDEKSKTMNMSYGNLTSGLMMYAKVNDHLVLHRITNAKPSDIDDMYQGARNSFDLYMDQLGFSSESKASILNSADGKFANLKTQLQEKGTMENDPYGALQEAKMSLLDFFANINAQIARQAALITIVQFKKLYSISLKRNFNFSNFKEILNEGKGKSMESYINDMYDFIDIENGSTITFRTDIMTGYVLTPILNDVRYNAESNTNELDISWSCINSTYLQSNDAETIEKATAYQYDLPDKDKLAKIIKSDQYSADDIFSICKAKVDTTTGFFEYNEEKQNLTNTYLNNSADYKISFKMPDASDPHAKCDPFYFGPDSIQKVNGQGKLSTETLAETGIKISFDGEKYEYLSDVIKSVNDENFDEKNATLSQKFVKNCEIYAEIEETNRATHAVTLKLVTRYKQTCLAQVDSFNLSKWTSISTIQSENAPLSEKLFMEYCTNYSNSVDYVNVYLDNKANTEMLVEKICLGVACLSTTLNIAGIIYIAILTAKHGPQKRYIVYLVIMSGGAVAGIVSIGLLSKLVDESVAFAKNVRDFNKEPVVQETFDTIKQGKDIFVKMSGPKFDEYDQNEYDRKYAVFKDADPDEMKKYNDIFINATKPDGAFNQKAREYGVSKNEYLNFVDQHSIEKTENLIAYILCGLSLIAGIATVIIIIVEAVNEKMNKKREMNKFEEAALFGTNKITNDYGVVDEIEEEVVCAAGGYSLESRMYAVLTLAHKQIIDALWNESIDYHQKLLEFATEDGFKS